MKKKLLILIGSLWILLICVGCQSYDISKMLFIASVGIEKKGRSAFGLFLSSFK